jgi:acyl dehydratase
MDIERIRDMVIEPITQTYDFRDTILYALGLGCGADPLDRSDLRYVYEKDLVCLPSFANVLCHPGFWAQKPEYGIDWVKILHAEQDLTIHGALPATGTVRGEYAVTGIEDKGEGRGALLHQTKRLYNAGDGTLLATVRSTLFMRGDGGQGGFGEAAPTPDAVPDGEPDSIIEMETLPRQALIYRLSGDYNPIHADPDLAAKAGFDMPILHGLCTHGIATRAILRGFCNNDASKLTSMFVRFSKPVMPGETIRCEFFETGPGQLRFRAIAKERGAVVLDRCSATYTV